ncbi:hypothetical protein AQJ84_32425 [Streptomyces resistomycificus]|uniref:Uncharacterized protein n=2 Tax=Streptomyces resistomycificus TaxID=67356 RepID=A0A0L8LWH1_9ACTN|nr:hypothetical protein ADK37_05320 [Streptomyces resistomycificus]KUN92684.1 hypothetical protein AQJ84_32425 [Streptomyces resistomycificus]
MPPPPDGLMPISRTARPTPPTVWLARGRHPGPDAQDVVLRRLQQLKDAGTIDDHDGPLTVEDSAESAFEARWRVDGNVTVRARLSLPVSVDGGQEWVLAAEAEGPWQQRWPSPATVFWPEAADVSWDVDAATGLRLRDVNRLPADDKEMRRLLRDAVRGSWAVNVVVHEAMTPDDSGRRPLSRLLPAGLRHRVVEHRAAPHQLRAVNWALREFDVQVPRGGAVVLPPAPSDAASDDFSVRSVFLDGSEPAELVDTLTRFVASPRPLPDGAEEAVTALRERWQLLTLEEELARERRLVAMYAEALDAMTKSRDLYREAAERANEALTAYRESAEGMAVPPSSPSAPAGSPLQQLTRTLERLRGSAKGPRPGTQPAADGGPARDDDAGR